MLSIKNLTKSYTAGKKALDDVSLSIEDGEIFAFIGHNGAGKTTAIKSIVGLLNFDSGVILLNDLDITKNPNEFKRLTAYIPDNPDIYENLTGLQYLHFISDIYRLDPLLVEELTIEYATVFEIKDRLGDLISNYSHGMKQKIALISALIRKPKLLLLDEPFVGLDPLAAFKVKEMMKALAKQGSIILFSTHVLDVAEKICDHVAIIKEGKIIKVGTMSEVKGDQSLEDVFLELTDHA